MLFRSLIMKITAQQLRQIIAEEIQKTILNETAGGKVILLKRAMELISDAGRNLEPLANGDETIATAMEKLNDVQTFLQGILDKK